MLPLSTKAKIYQYTGIHLARAEELAHVTTIEGANTISRLMRKEGYSGEEAVKAVVAMWQADNGFGRPSAPRTVYLNYIVNRIRRRRLRAFLWKSIMNVVIAYRVLRSDIGL